MEVNGSSSDGYCLDSIQNASTFMVCFEVKTSVLFDGLTPSLTDFNNTWAAELLILQPPSFDESTEIFVEWYEAVLLSRIEVVMFNCPEWGLGVESIRFIVPIEEVQINVMLSTPPTSCDSLVTACFTVPSQGYDFGRLQFFLFPNSHSISVAEVRFFQDVFGEFKIIVAKAVESILLTFDMYIKSCVGED